MMMRYVIHDTRGHIRHVESDLTPDQLKVALVNFKTHCAIDGSVYEYNHFKNWLKVNKGEKLSEIGTVELERIDM